jgi:hypothetical protein
MIEWIKTIPTIILFLTILSCSSGTLRTEINNDDRPDAGKGYIYGRFYQKSFHQVEVGIFIENIETKKAYQIPFRRDTLLVFKAKPVFAIVVDPGTYRIKSGYGAQANILGPLVKERNLNQSVLGGTFTVEQGKAYYIGDFAGSSRAAYFRRIVWEVDSFKENFDKTSDEFRKGYEKFGSVEMINVIE